MLICFNAKPQAQKALDSIMSEQQFTDASDAISAALVSYEALCKAHSQGGMSGLDALIRGETVPAAEAYNASSLDVRPPAAREAQKPRPRLPELFTIYTPTVHADELPPTPAADAHDELPPPQRWPFGQYNKLLPVKATCRALLNLQQDNPRGLPLTKAAAQIANEAWQLGDFLYTLDSRQLKGREEAFTAAFPVSVGNGAQSQVRFANQFVGYLKQGKLAGLPAELGLVVCDNDKDSRLSLTRAGHAFAVLDNPIFDLEKEKATRRLSPVEIQFLLDHIRHFVPHELSAYLAILHGLATGHNTPETLDQHLALRFNLQVVIKAQKPIEITKTFLSTQRTGAISRMADLGLLAREKTGLKVAYLTTNAGTDFRNQSTPQ